MPKNIGATFLEFICRFRLGPCRIVFPNTDLYCFCLKSWIRVCYSSHWSITSMFAVGALILRISLPNTTFYQNQNSIQSASPPHTSMIWRESFTSKSCRVSAMRASSYSFHSGCYSESDADPGLWPMGTQTHIGRAGASTPISTERASSHRTRKQLCRQILWCWCCLWAVWTFPFTTVGPIRSWCLLQCARRPGWKGPKILVKTWDSGPRVRLANGALIQQVRRVQGWGGAFCFCLKKRTSTHQRHYHCRKTFPTRSFLERNFSPEEIYPPTATNTTRNFFSSYKMSFNHHTLHLERLFSYSHLFCPLMRDFLYVARSFSGHAALGLFSISSFVLGCLLYLQWWPFFVWGARFYALYAILEIESSSVGAGGAHLSNNVCSNHATFGKKHMKAGCILRWKLDAGPG